MQFTKIPILVKIFKLIVYELGDHIEAHTDEKEVVVRIIKKNVLYMSDVFSIKLNLLSLFKCTGY